jgi:16S rRNA (cytidine1402-2'-O)-methyltransferase
MSVIYLVPSFLSEDSVESIPAYIINAVKDCKVIFAENERTSRRFLKQLDRSVVIDHFEWHTIHKAEEEQIAIFKKAVSEGKNIAIISDAGCPGIADPGQKLVEAAQELKLKIRPLVGPNSILLALMASGMNGQQFEFVGYLPIDNHERIKSIKELETASAKFQSTKIFIETPYRNNQIIEAILKTCEPNTRLCIAADLTSNIEDIRTMTIRDWKKNIPDIHKRPAIFLLQA